MDFLDDSLSPQCVSPQQSPRPNPPKVQAASLPLKQPHQSLQITTIWHPVDNDAPAHNTRSRKQVWSITQEALLACIHVHNDITGCPFTAHQASRRQFPCKILNTITPTLAPSWKCATCHLLVNPKYKELWGKSYTMGLGCLSQGIPGVSKGTNTIVFIG